MARLEPKDLIPVIGAIGAILAACITAYAILAAAGKVPLKFWKQPLSIPQPSASVSPIPRAVKPEPEEAKMSPLGRSKLFIRGSFNEVYFFWGDVAIRSEPFTVTAQGEHTHIQLPNGLPVDVEFDGHDNVAWCRAREIVGLVKGDGVRGNKFELRDESFVASPTPSVKASASRSASPTTSQRSSSNKHFTLLEGEWAEGPLKIFVVKVFANRRGVDLSVDSLDASIVFEALIGQPVSVPTRPNYVVTLVGFDGDAAMIEISHRE